MVHTLPKCRERMAISATQIQIENASFDGYVHHLKQVTRKSELNDRTVLIAHIFEISKEGIVLVEN
jgi:hypothetical protein